MRPDQFESWSIYSLIDPITKDVRYVGWTMRPVANRLRCHITESIRVGKTYKHRWIRSLISRGLEPLIEVLETGAGAGFAEAEIRWIDSFRAYGTRLVNITDGGEGAANRFTPEERKAIRRKGFLNTTSEQRSAAARKGFANRTPEQRSAGGIAAAAIIRSPEQRAMASQRTKNRYAAMSLAERREQMRVARLAITFESRSRASKKISAQTSPEEKTRMAKARVASWSANKTPQQIQDFYRKFNLAGNAAKAAKRAVVK